MRGEVLMGLEVGEEAGLEVAEVRGDGRSESTSLPTVDLGEYGMVREGAISVHGEGSSWLR